MTANRAGAADPDPPPDDSAAVGREAWHDARHRVLGFLVSQGIRGRDERERWLNRLLAEVEREDPTVFGSPQATVRAIDAFERLRGGEDDSAERAKPKPETEPEPWLPAERRRPMPRQPLGELPSVLQGSFWARTARWAWPKRFWRRHAVDPPAAIDSANDAESRTNPEADPNAVATEREPR